MVTREESGSTEHISAPVDSSALARDLQGGPRGALFLATASVLFLLAGWLAFYFLLFVPRGPIG
ncbi:hypothetical protein OZ411_40515 [Bradyrhizobium sp. Arg237L]|uniref:hypothetical protein n=1 Tax=Bradyrhizobium sp. Arg237L TaxID=3003352 RepID=UPI00249E7F3B|nr:hypothetical protein [Bradyrhizobium sp. Arg237L]MDI4239077.1 hypothetical protein [Bradyrhizobium sp. Arg237L]